MRGGVRHRVLADQPFAGEARTLPHYALFDLGAYPGLVHRGKDGRSIQGELYEIDSGLIARLDRIEGAPSLFRLEPVRIENYPGDVYAYFYQQDTTGFALCAQDRWLNKGCTS